MAIIINDTDLNTKEYVKIIDNECYINKNGIYSYAIVYKDINEREKEKNRFDEINEFERKLMEYKEYKTAELLKKLNIDSLTNITNEMYKNLEENDVDFLNFLSEASFLFNNYRIFYIRGDETETSSELFKNLNSKILNLLYSFGFKMEWIDNPIHVIREEIVLISNYDKSDFTLENFYDKYKTFTKRYISGTIEDC